MAIVKPLYSDGVDYIEMSVADEMDLARVGLTAAPAADTDATNKLYVDTTVDALIDGLRIKELVKVASTAAITLATDVAAGLTLDGVTLVAGDRILLKDQVDPTENGIYVVTAGAPVRADDLADGFSAAAAAVWVDQGDTLAESKWVASNDKGADVIGVDGIDWRQFGAQGSISAGDGILKTGDTLSVDLAVDPGLEFAASKLQAMIDGTTLKREAAGLSVLGLPAAGTWQIDGVDSSVNATAPNVNTLVDDGVADGLHAHRGLRLITADGVIAKGDPVSVSTTTADRHAKAVANDTSPKSTVVGVADAAMADGDTGSLITSGVVPGVLTGATNGAPVYMAPTGGLALVKPTTAGQYSVIVGYAISATDLFVEPRRAIKMA